MPVASKSASRTPRSRSIRGILVGIVIACVVPGWLGMAALIQAVYTSERERTAQDLIVTARAIALALDGYLLFTRTTLEVMGTAPDLQSGDLAAFHKRISALAGKLPGNNILLTDRSGQQLINTFMPFGASLPTHAKPENLDRVFSTGRPIITDLFVGAVAKRPLVAIEVPVFRDGEVKYVLSAGLFPEHLSELLVLQKLPPGWGVAIYDTSGITVARSSRIADFVGQRGPPEVIDMMARRVSGFAETVTLEGIPVFGALSRSETSDWAVGIGVPVAEINRNLYRFLEVSGAGAFLLLVAMVGLAAHQSRRITSAVQALVGPVAAFGQGEVPSIPPSGIREIDGVAQGFEQALRVLQHRTDERDLAAREKEVAERAARAKGEFIGTVSHELRTPLTSITASLALLKNTADAGRSAATTRLIEIAHSNSQRLARLVNDILDIEKLEAGKVVFDMQLVEVDALIERAIEVNGPMAESLPRQAPPRKPVPARRSRRPRPADAGRIQSAVQRHQVLATGDRGRGDGRGSRRQCSRVRQGPWSGHSGQLQIENVREVCPGRQFRHAAENGHRARPEHREGDRSAAGGHGRLWRCPRRRNGVLRRSAAGRAQGRRRGRRAGPAARDREKPDAARIRSCAGVTGAHPDQIRSRCAPEILVWRMSLDGEPRTLRRDMR